MARSACSYSDLPPGPTALQSGYQPGGTFMATTGRWTTRSNGKPILDPSGLGRWSGLWFHRKRGKKLAIITAYRSHRQQLKGGYGFYDQQFALLLSMGIKQPNVRKQFITDITRKVNQLQAEGYEILCSLDANETHGEDEVDGIASMISSCSLSDPHCLASSHPQQRTKSGVTAASTSCSDRRASRRWYAIRQQWRGLSPPWPVLRPRFSCPPRRRRSDSTGGIKRHPIRGPAVG